MNYLDVRINELSTEVDTHLLRSSQPLGWVGLSRCVRRGRLKRVIWVLDIMHLLLLALGLWAAVRFFDTTDILLAMKYGISSAVLLIISLQLKLSLMPHIQAERVLREIKRVEILLLAKNHKPSKDTK